MKKYLEQSPLVTAIFEVRFTKLPKMKEYLESIHQVLMPLGYAHAFQSERSGHDITINGANQEVKKISLGSRCDYLNLEKNRKVVLEDERIIVQTAKYKTFEDFYAYIEEVLKVVFDNLPNLQHTGVERIGLRYVDTMLPAKHHKIDEYIEAKYLGPSLSWLSTELTPISNVQATAQTKLGILRTQFEQLYWLPDQHKRVRLVPVDLLHQNEPHELLYGIDKKKIADMTSGQRFGIFNSDYIHNSSPAKPFILEYIFSTLNDMYQDSSEAFWKAITDYAQEEWGIAEKNNNSVH